MKRNCFKVFNLKDFNELRNIKLDEIYIILISNIDFSNDNFKPFDFEGKTVFIDGRNHSINGLNINQENNQVGLISKVNNLIVRNLSIENAIICGNEVCGTLAGEVDNNLIADNVNVNTKIKCDSIGGGMCGISKNINIVNCSIVSKIEGRGVLGGICGMADTFSQDKFSNIKTDIISTYSDYVKDPAIGNEIGYLCSERNLKLINNLYDLYKNNPVKFSNEEMDNLKKLIHNKC